jgi:Holliday junction resolvase RusA-like endonuclease
VIFSAVIEGVPAPKGNSRQVWRIKGKRRVIMAPSPKFLNWQGAAKWQLNLAKTRAGLRAPFVVPVKVDATFYRDARADVDNLCKALGDVLQHCGIIHNDRLIHEWAVRRKPPEGRPRVEFTIVEAL